MNFVFFIARGLSSWFTGLLIGSSPRHSKGKGHSNSVCVCESSAKSFQMRNVMIVVS